MVRDPDGHAVMNNFPPAALEPNRKVGQNERLGKGLTLLLKPHFRYPTYTPKHSVVAFYGTAHYQLCLLVSYLDLPGLIPEIARCSPSNGPTCFSNTVPAARYGAFGD